MNSKRSRRQDCYEKGIQGLSCHSWQGQDKAWAISMKTATDSKIWQCFARKETWAPASLWPTNTKLDSSNLSG